MYRITWECELLAKDLVKLRAEIPEGLGVSLIATADGFLDNLPSIVEQVTSWLRAGSCVVDTLA